MDVFDTVWTSTQGFEFRQAVTVDRPHVAVEAGFTPREGAPPFLMTALAVVEGPDCATA